MNREYKQRTHEDIHAELMLVAKQVPILERGSWKWINKRFQFQAITRLSIMIGGEWVPLSQVRIDVDQELVYIAAWLYKKNDLRNKLLPGKIDL